MNVRVFRMSDDRVAGAAARRLQVEGVAARAGARQHCALVVVTSDRDDINLLVRTLLPAAVPVNLEHLPAPLPNEVALFS